MAPIQVGDIYLIDFENRGWTVGDGSQDPGNGLVSSQSTPIDLVIPSEYDSKPVLVIGPRAFYSILLNSISLPDSIIQIDSSSIDGCYLKLPEFKLPTQLQSIGYYAFSTNYIQKFVIGPNVVYIEEGVFGDNPTLEEIEVSSENKNFCCLKGCLYDINLTTLYCIPPLVKNFQFPVTVQTLITRSVSLSNTVLWLPTSVKCIQASAFFRTPNLKQIHILGNLNNISANIFFSIPQITIFYHGQTIVSQNDVVNLTKTTAKAFVCKQYEGTNFSNIPTTIYGSCYQMYIHQTKNIPHFLSSKLFITFILFC